jgi:ATP-dependent Lon protease
VQPLHIFEPRYCDMLADSMASDRLIAMALLKEGWESQYQNRPPLDKAVCIGKVISHTPTADGRHNILLVGTKRAQIIQELDTGVSYRSAEVQVLDDYYPSVDDAQRPALTARLQELFSHFVPEGLAAQESFKQLVGRHLPLGILTDTITYALTLPLAIKQQLLSESNVDIRCRLLTRCLEQKIKQESSGECDESHNPDPDDFPPRFSVN